MKTTAFFLVLFLLFSAISCSQNNTKSDADTAASYYFKKKFDSAAFFCTKAINSNPTRYDLYYLRALSFLYLPSYKGAIADFTTCIKASINLRDCYFYRAFCRERIQQFNEAVADYSKSISQDTNDAAAYVNRGAIYEDHLGEHHLAELDFMKANMIEPNQVTTLRDLSHAYLSLGKNEEVVRSTTQIIKLDPSYADAYFERSRAKLNLGFYIDAVFDLSQAIRIDSSKARYYSELAAAYVWLRDWPHAIKAASKSLQMEDTILASYSNRAIAEGTTGQYNLALIDYSKALALDSANSCVLLNLGYLKLSLGSLDEASLYIDKAIKYDKRNYVAFNVRGYMHFLQRRYELAINDYDASVAIGGPTYLPYFNYRLQSEKAISDSSRNETGHKANLPFISVIWVSPVSPFNDRLVDLSTSHVQIQIAVSSNSQLSSADFSIGLLNERFNKNRPLRVDEVSDLIVKGEHIYKLNTLITVDTGETDITLNINCSKCSAASTSARVRFRPKQARLTIVSIGTQGPDLTYSRKDAQDFQDLFKNQSGSGKLYSSINFISLIGDKAKATNIADAIASLASKKMSINDVIIVFVSCHGFIHSSQLRFECSDFTSTLMDRTSLSFDDEIFTPLSQLSCKKYIFIDACHSGTATNGSKGNGVLDINNAIGAIIAANNDFAILASSSANQISWEDEVWANGAFTKAIVDGLKRGYADANNDGIVGMEELANYVKMKVPELVEHVKKQPQDPSWSNKVGDIPLYTIGQK